MTKHASKYASQIAIIYTPVQDVAVRTLRVCSSEMVRVFYILYVLDDVIGIVLQIKKPISVYIYNFS